MSTVIRHSLRISKIQSRRGRSELLLFYFNMLLPVVDALDFYVCRRQPVQAIGEHLPAPLALLSLVPHRGGHQRGKLLATVLVYLGGC